MFILLSHLRVSNVFDAVLRNKQNLPITGEKEEETIQRLKYLNKVVCLYLFIRENITCKCCNPSEPTFIVCSGVAVENTNHEIFLIIIIFLLIFLL